MTKVKDLIKHSIFKKSKKFDELNPDVTIPLPTFRRGDSGLFEKCLKSILNQTYKNFELIIIDDASVDSTSEIINKYMAEDDRIAVIRHEKNIGLPAVSEAEAILNSRGKFFFWAFDDNEFKPYALEKLYNYLKDNTDAIGVYAAAHVESCGFYNGDSEFDYRKLHAFNYIPNSPLILRKEALDEFGLYDPHITMARICDWDLWLRIAKKYSLHRLKETLAIEKGPTLNDSLLNSYAINTDVIREWMTKDRDEALKPHNILEYEIDNMPENISKYSQHEISRLYREKYGHFYWSNPNFNYTDKSGSYIVVLCDKKDNSLELALLNLDKELKQRIVVVEYSAIKLLFLADIFLHANSIIIFKPKGKTAKRWVEMLAKLNVKHFIFDEYNLVNKFKKIFNPNIKFINYIIDKKEFDNVKTVGNKFENTDRINILLNCEKKMCNCKKYISALEKLSLDGKIKLYLVQNDKKQSQINSLMQYCKKNSIDMETIREEFHYGAYLTLLNEKNIHFIIKTDKTKGTEADKLYIDSYLTSSIPLFPNLYSEKENKKYQYKNLNDLIDKIENLVKNEPDRTTALKAFHKFCKQRFSSDKTEEFICSLLNNQPTPRNKYLKRVLKNIKYFKFLNVELGYRYKHGTDKLEYRQVVILGKTVYKRKKYFN